MQYTIRKVPKAVDKALRAKAKAEKKSLNQLAVEALAMRAGVAADAPACDLSFFGNMSEEDARAIEEAHAWFDSVGPLPREFCGSFVR